MYKRREWHHARCGIICHLHLYIRCNPTKLNFVVRLRLSASIYTDEFVWSIISTENIHCSLFVWAENIISIVSTFYFLFVWAENIILTENVQRACHIWSQWHLIVFTFFRKCPFSFRNILGEINPTHNTANYNTQTLLFQIQKKDSGERSLFNSRNLRTLGFFVCHHRSIQDIWSPHHLRL